MKIFSKLTILFSLLVIFGCSSKVIRHDENSSYEYLGEKYSKVELSVKETATSDPNDILRFDNIKLQKMIEKNLEVSGLIDENSINFVKVDITDIRIRSSLNAFMWGALAGNDHIRGDVTLIGQDNKPLYQFHVTASYALGGCPRIA